MSLDNLRALDAAAKEAEGLISTPEHPAFAAVRQLAGLSHHLLPAMETLEKCAEKIEHTASSHASEQWAEAAQARAVLAKLEDALK